ncbi:MAG: AEC family transporter [Desulfobacterota bacterium]|nr:AEC family transporter [Thermodesulfobacteriota bacterium]MDW8001073.1 AEC family transporter [Deltaproteobacteria bacterium]
MGITEAIIPIFLVILFGYFVKKAGFFDETTIKEMNRFTFNFLLPILVFLGITKSSLELIKLKNLLLILFPTAITLSLSVGSGILLKLNGSRFGTFVQTSIHGNVSYVGLAVLFYTLGEEALQKGSFLVGSLILLNNTIGIISHHLTVKKIENGFFKAILSIFKTPVIVATFAGILFVWKGIRIPQVIFKTMNILSHVTLPMALIMLGATMKLGFSSGSSLPAIIASIFKLFSLPFFALPIIKFFCIPDVYAHPAIILLSSPVAISSYVMARELGGDSKLASDAIAFSTLLSPLSFVLWNHVLGIK